ncbi:hypothetical protein [Pedobacter sp. ASV28]|uniref:hypothetical protein n=1 Tax=Pedobacter sp. ASV28 TaxID=2795123 RepID=UPI0018EA701E|nr:hypothetical protein [Pedobacter sp. ASV28]
MIQLSYSPRVSNFVDAADVSGNIRNVPLYLQYLHQIDVACKKADITTGAVYPIVGGNATSHSFNFLDPRDLDAAFRLTFKGTWTHDNQGAFSINTAYANTFITPFVDLSPTDCHISLMGSINNRNSMGATTTVTNRISLQIAGNLNNFYIGAFGPEIRAITASNLCIGSQLGSTAYISINRMISSTANVTTILPNFPIYIGAINNGNTPGTPSSQNHQFCSVGKNIDMIKSKAFSHGIYTAQRSIGR